MHAQVLARWKKFWRFCNVTRKCYKRVHNHMIHSHHQSSLISPDSSPLQGPPAPYQGSLVSTLETLLLTGVASHHRVDSTGLK